jgi:hypothetical protein
MDGNARDVLSDAFDLSGVNSGAHFKADLANGTHDGGGTPDGPRRAIERRQETIAGCGDLTPVEPIELVADERVVAIKQCAPGMVAEDACPLGRPHDVGEQDRCQDPIVLGRRADAASIGGSSNARSERPAPRTSIVMSRENEASRSRNRAKPGSSH